MRAVLATIFFMLIAFTSTEAQAQRHHSKHHVRHSHHLHQQSHRHVRRHHYHGRAVASRRSETTLAAATPWQHAAHTLAGTLAQYLGTNPTGWPRNWCGEMLGRVAKAVGYTPPPGYAVAANWRHFGRPVAGPVPGAIMVMPHHVAVVTAVLGNGRVRTISANHNRRVAYGDYSVRRAIAWRVAG
jgi:hypothetical protein